MIYNWSAVTLEVAALGMGLLLLVLGLVFSSLRTSPVLGYLSIAGLFALLVGSVCLPHSGTETFLNGFYIQDSLALFFKQLFIVAALLVNAMALYYMKPFTTNRGDFFALTFFALAGMMIMASAGEFITLYIGLELMTLTFVLLTAYKKHDLKSGEAGLKYILLSAVSSGILLYGISLLYGLTGTTDFASMITAFHQSGSSPLLVWGIVMVLSGLAFKISLVPFHMWTPDIYEGAPTPITAFLAVGSKAAGFVALIRIFFHVFANFSPIFMPLLVALTVLTLIIGNLVAIAQTHIKRLLAYSSIAHAGYILLGVIAYSQMGLTAVLFYLLLYLFANIGAFAAVTALVMQTGHDRICDWSGLWKRSPFVSSVLLISLLSLAGIPPTAGFIGKFYLFAEVIRQGHTGLAVLALGMSLVAIYYYLMVIRTFLSGSTTSGSNTDTFKEKPAPIPLSLKLVMLVSAGMTLAIGVFPSFFTDYVMRIAQGFLG